MQQNSPVLIKSLINIKNNSSDGRTIAAVLSLSSFDLHLILFAFLRNTCNRIMFLGYEKKKVTLFN